MYTYKRTRPQTSFPLQAYLADLHWLLRFCLATPLIQHWQESPLGPRYQQNLLRSWLHLHLLNVFEWWVILYQFYNISKRRNFRHKKKELQFDVNIYDLDTFEIGQAWGRQNTIWFCCFFIIQLHKFYTCLFKLNVSCLKRRQNTITGFTVLALCKNIGK